jgi:hypothetical protein
MMSRKAAIWIGIWVILIIAACIAMKRARDAYDAYMVTAPPPPGAILKLIPEESSLVLVDPDFREHWTKFRNSDLYRSVLNLPPVKKELSTWSIAEPGGKLTPFEEWILAHWNSSLTAAYVRSHQTMIFYSISGNREATLDWLRSMFVSGVQSLQKINPVQFQEHWAFELVDGASVGLPGMKVQFTAVDGVAILAVGAKENPLEPVFQILEKKSSSLLKIRELSGESLRNLSPGTGDRRIRGLVRVDTATQKGKVIEWEISPRQQEPGFSLRLMTPFSVQFPDFETPGHWKQPDDVIAFSWNQRGIHTVLQELTRQIGADFSPYFMQMSPDKLGGYQDFWMPVFEKSASDWFVSFGRAEVISDRFRLPFPSFVVVTRFPEKSTFLKALEQTVLKANQDLQAELVIRKTVKPYGEYYEIQMGNSGWRGLHGLRELPSIAFSGDLLVIGSHRISIEKALEHLQKQQPADATQPRRSSVLEITANLSEAPEVVRILLGTLGMLNPQGENVFISPKALSAFSDVAGVMKLFGRSSFSLREQVVDEGGDPRLVLEANFTPASPTEPTEDTPSLLNY